MRKIMIVEDEAEMIFILKSLLKKEGCNVIVASSGEECLDKLKTTKPDLILLDIKMPDMDGWVVCKKIKEDKSTSSIPVSMLSTKGNPEDVEKSLEYANADWHLILPPDIKGIKDGIKSLLREIPVEIPSSP